MTNRLGQVTQSTYDNLNRQVAVNYLTDVAGDAISWDAYCNWQSIQNNSVAYIYGYDALNRLLYKSDSRNSKLMSFTYDAAGNIKTKTDFQGDMTHYAYDSANNLVGMSNSAYLQAAYQHDGAGRVLARMLSNGAKAEYAYNAAGRVISEKVTTANGTVMDYVGYARDRVGNIVTQTDHGGVMNYVYDPLYRLTSASYADGSTESFAYDAVGNRTSATLNGVAHAYEYWPASNRLKAVHAGTVTGAVEKSFVYDDEGRLVSQGGTGAKTIQWNQVGDAANIGGVDFVYDPLGYRIGSSAVGDYYLDGEHLEAVYSGSQPQAKFYRGVGTDELLAGFSYVGGKWTPAIFQQDALMSVTGISSHDGSPVWSADYTAFGDRLIGATGKSGNNLQYTGRENDGTGLYYYRARYYDPSIGRFISEDPLGFQAGINFYAYVNNNPVNGNDPSGQIGLIDNAIGGGIAGAIDVAAQYTQAMLAGKSFSWDWKQTAVATGFGIATSGASVLLGDGVAGLGYGTGTSLALRTGGNSLLGGAANVGQTATMNYLEGKNDNLGTAFLWGGGFGGAGSVAADGITGLSSAINAAKFNSLSPGQQGFATYMADVNGYRIGGPSSYATAVGTQTGNFVGSLPAFNPGDTSPAASTPSTTSSLGGASFSDLSGMGGGSFPGAAGGFLLYPNKPNTNQIRVYSKP